MSKIDLKKKSLKELREYARKNKIKGYSQLNKADLIKLINKWESNKKINSVKNKKSKSPKKQTTKKQIVGESKDSEYYTFEILRIPLEIQKYLTNENDLTK